MAHYEDYRKKAISVSNLTFEPVSEKDKDVIKRVKKAHIKANMLFVVLLGISCVTPHLHIERKKIIGIAAPGQNHPAFGQVTKDQFPSRGQPLLG